MQVSRQAWRQSERSSICALAASRCSSLISLLQYAWRLTQSLRARTAACACVGKQSMLSMMFSCSTLQPLACASHTTDSIHIPVSDVRACSASRAQASAGSVCLAASTAASRRTRRRCACSIAAAPASVATAAWNSDRRLRNCRAGNASQPQLRLQASSRCSSRDTTPGDAARMSPISGYWAPFEIQASED